MSETGLWIWLVVAVFMFIVVGFDKSYESTLLKLFGKVVYMLLATISIVISATELMHMYGLTP